MWRPDSGASATTVSATALQTPMAKMMNTVKCTQLRPCQIFQMRSTFTHIKVVYVNGNSTIAPFIARFHKNSARQVKISLTKPIAKLRRRSEFRRSRFGRRVPTTQTLGEL